MAIDTTIKAGYKQTELGLIPNDWDTVVLKDIVSPDRKITYGIVVPGPFIQNGIPLIRAQDYSTGWVSIDELYRVSHELDKAFKRSKVVVGDVLLTIVGSVGNVTKVPIPFGGSNITQQTARISFNQKLSNPDYYINILLSDVGKKEILNYKKSGVQPSLNLSDVEKFVLPYPPLEEQTAIATVLFDTDTLIDHLEKLIDKKKAVKQGTMQQLLTGKKRLPGFNGEWENKKLGEICKITTGRKDVNEGNPSGFYPFFTCSRNYTFSNSYSFDKEAILVAGNGEVGNLHYYKGKFEAYQRTYVLIDFVTDVKYLWYQLDAFLTDSLGIGKIGSSIPYIKMENLVDFEFHRPTNKEEQTVIATILSDMDKEIEGLEKKRDKYVMIKQGMMQQLLTGKIRLYAN